MLPADASSLAPVLPTPAQVYDKDTNQYFEVTRKDGELFQSQYSRDAGGKEIFRQDKRLDYVIGAGDNGFGFLVQRDHYLFEAPLSYFSTTHSWGFSPGFEIQNRGFTRPILDRCIVCHSGRANPVLGQVGLYKAPPFDELAVGCENCHGPGALHVNQRTLDESTSIEPTLGEDRTIVNPARLSGWLADNICMSCHQGQDVRVEMSGKHIQDFRPGKPLGDFVSVFKIAPQPGASASALPLEHYFGMTMSKCYQASHNLHCITCHDPHVDPSGPEATANYRAQCLRCHTEQSCKLEAAKRRATHPADDCLSCHMPKRTVTTITHAALTDHSIPAQSMAGQPIPESGHKAEPKLLLLTAPPDKQEQVQTISPTVLLQAYDSLVREGHHEFGPLLNQLSRQVASGAISDPAVLRALARTEFRKNTPAATLKAKEYINRVVTLGSANIDDYLFLSNLYVRTEDHRAAVAVLEKARTTSPYFREVYENLATEYMALGSYGDALAVLQTGIEIFPNDFALRDLKKKAAAATLPGP